jgi:catechol 2,3-dioxygenase-like lactoylglutathione lyase family enzyme
MISGITGAHWLIYSNDAEADRAFFRDVLGFRAVDAGEGWLIFVLPPSEMGVHPGDGKFTLGHAGHHLTGAVLYLMCDDVHATVQSLEARDVPHSPIGEAEWGLHTILRLPSGGEVGLYQPTHPRAV